MSDQTRESNIGPIGLNVCVGLDPKYSGRGMNDDWNKRAVEPTWEYTLYSLVFQSTFTSHLDLTTFLGDRGNIASTFEIPVRYVGCCWPNRVFTRGRRREMERERERERKAAAQTGKTFDITEAEEEEEERQMRALLCVCLVKGFSGFRFQRWRQ